MQVEEKVAEVEVEVEMEVEVEVEVEVVLLVSLPVLPLGVLAS